MRSSERNVKPQQTVNNMLRHAPLLLLGAAVCALLATVPPTHAKSPQPGQEEAPMDYNNTLCIDAQLGNLHNVRRSLERVRTTGVVHVRDYVHEGLVMCAWVL